MVVRLAAFEDLDLLQEIYDRARAFMRETGNPTQWPAPYPSRKILENDIRLQRLYVCEIDSRIEGVFVFYTGIEESYLTIDGAWLNDRAYGVIHRIASAGRIKGMGKRILDYCFARIDTIRIDTHENNLPMQNMLKQYGFSYTGVVFLKEIGESRLAFQMTKE